MSRGMDALDPILAPIKEAAEAEGLPAFAKRCGIPYTTLVHWRKADWRPGAVDTLGKLIAATSNDSSSTQGAAA